MEQAKLMQLEIEQKRKLPKNVKESISTHIFQNLIGALIIMAYLVAINITYYKVSNTIFEQYMKYFALGIIILTVVDFEIAYRKSSFKFTVIGIELLICGILSLYIPYIYLHTTSTLRNSIMLLPAILIIYYAFKSTIIFKQKQFHYQNNLSDVKEIVKISENRSYLDENSKKLYKEKKIEEEKIRREIVEKQNLKRNERLKFNSKEKEEKKTEDAYMYDVQEVKKAIVKSRNLTKNRIQNNRNDKKRGK